MSDTRLGWGIVHGMVCAVPCWFAFIFSVPPSTFESNPNAYAVMASIMSEHAWAVCSGVVGALGIASWFINSVHIWRLVSLLLSAWHCCVALSILQANSAGTGSGTYAIIAVGATAKMLRRFP